MVISTLITDAFPNDYATDGSVSYQRIIQRVLKEMGSERKVIVFPPMVYRFEDASGLSLPSNTTLLMYGAVFLLSEDFQEDGQVFHGRDVKNLSFMGGEILGRRDAWAENTNVRGIHITGRSCDILIRDMIFRDLSSNAIGIFGISSKEGISYVRVQNIRTIRCSTIYRDYLHPHPGPIPGSDRTDQFEVSGCRLEGSCSDATHFMGCTRGQIIGNTIAQAQMGGLFLEGCEDVVAIGNLIRRNGSRGVTIERDSLRCILANNIVEENGREGLWTYDVAGLIVSGNFFRHNGRKDDRDLDAEIRVDNTERWKTETRDICIVNNIFETTAHQLAAIRVTSGKHSIRIEGNLFKGEARQIWVDEPGDGISG